MFPPSPSSSRFSGTEIATRKAAQLPLSMPEAKPPWASPGHTSACKKAACDGLINCDFEQLDISLLLFMYWVYLWLLMCIKQNCEVSLLNTIIFKTPFFMCGKQHCQRHKIQNFKQTSASRLNLKIDQVNSAKLLLILRQYFWKNFFLRSRWEMYEENIFFCGEEKNRTGKVGKYWTKYTTWLVKWIAKRETIQLAQLCITRWWIV